MTDSSGNTYSTKMMLLCRGEGRCLALGDMRLLPGLTKVRACDACGRMIDPSKEPNGYGFLYERQWDDLQARRAAQQIVGPR
jgi:hypothetical protein